MKEKRRKREVKLYGLIHVVGTVSKPNNHVLPAVACKPNQPSCYSSWEEERREMWDRIPFNANEYYMHYLPPGVEQRPSVWSSDEIEEFQSLLKV